MTVQQKYLENEQNVHKAIRKAAMLLFCYGCGEWKDKREYTYFGYHNHVCKECMYHFYGRII